MAVETETETIVGATSYDLALRQFGRLDALSLVFLAE